MKTTLLTIVGALVFFAVIKLFGLFGVLILLGIIWLLSSKKGK